uniref:G-protein coupled receptors family 1 profile domain-containing protein n=1 Tax=Cavia porcellus TaxID=10141 RepID=A0A286XZ87_CAVPO
FFLNGITDHPELQVPLFLVSLAFADACTSSSVTPRMLNILDRGQMISLFECMVQYYVFGFSATTECFLLVVMAYDHYVAILVMSDRFCTCLVSIVYAIGFIHPIIHVGLLFRLTFCKSNIIDRFYCEILPLYTISCTGPSINVLVVFIFAAFIQAITFMSIIVSYTHVLVAVLKMKSEKGRSRAFSTCSGYLLSVCLFYGTLFIMYVGPGSGPDKYQDKIYLLFYTIIIPLLNPFIYSLRNKEVLNELRKVIKK